MIDEPDDSSGGVIIVEVRLSDVKLKNRIESWLQGNPSFLLSPSDEGKHRHVVISDHVPDDCVGPVILLASDAKRSDWELDRRIAARLSSTTDFIKLRIAIEAVAYGMALTDKSDHAPSSAGTAPILTARESQVLSMLAEGASNKMIARRLDISIHTAKFHVKSILEKLDATTRTEAVMQAARLGLFML